MGFSLNDLGIIGCKSVNFGKFSSFKACRLFMWDFGYVVA